MTTSAGASTPRAMTCGVAACWSRSAGRLRPRVGEREADRACWYLRLELHVRPRQVALQLGRHDRRLAAPLLRSHVRHEAWVGAPVVSRVVSDGLPVDG